MTGIGRIKFRHYMPKKSKIFSLQKKKIALIIFVLFFIFSSLVVFVGIKAISSNQSDKNFANEITKHVPHNFKVFLKKTLFIVPSLKKEISEKEKKIFNLKKDITYKRNKISEILNELYKHVNAINFKKLEEKKVIKSSQNEYLFSKFTTNMLGNKKGPSGEASAYLEYLNGNVIIGSGDGIFSYFKSTDLNKTSFQAKIIPSNLKNIIKYEDFYKTSAAGIKDLLINNNKLYVSYSNQLKKDCYNTSILVANFNLDFLKFENFFTPINCIKMKRSINQTGGRIVKFKDDKLIFSIGDWLSRDDVQDKSKLFGKIISIDIKTKNHQIISLGHRNPQGLYYDNKKNIIVSTEHGPKGGDEININFSPNAEIIENYGWPISSYGRHYGEYNNPESYKKYPLYKSHSDHGFIEPLKVYKVAIAISEIIKLPKEFDKNAINDFFVSAMGNNLREGDLSIHHISLDENYEKIIKEDIIPIGERIRDLIYIQDLNKVILFLENSASIGILGKRD